MPIYDESLNNYVANSSKRQAELDALLAQSASANTNAIKQLQELGIGGSARPFTQPMTLAGAGISASPTITSTPTGSYYGPSTSPDVAYDENVLGLDRRAEEYKEFQKQQDALEPKWTMINGILSYGGIPFTGDKGYERYENGILTATATKDENGKLIWKPVTSGKTNTDANNDLIAKQNQAAIDAANKMARQSAYDLLYAQFKQYGLESLVEGIKGLIQENVSPSEFAIRLQGTDAYKQRFIANQDRIKAGLRALTPAEYIGLEDQYQNIMRNYGLPASYYTKDAMGTQAGFNKFIANDVSAAELEDRIATAQKRVLNADVNVTNALRQFYPDITNADILAYTLDPTNALENIKRKVTAAEIGGAALGQNLMTSAGRAEELAKYGITKAQAQQGYGTIGEFLPTAEKLGDIYANQGLGAYDQAVAEAEVFGTAGAAEAANKRKKLSELERATFSGSAGAAGGALDRGRQGAY